MAVKWWLLSAVPLFTFRSLVGGVEVTNLGKPLSIPASQYWDGDDGPWSTFRIEVGKPAQQVRILPASDQSATWLVLPEACLAHPEQDCADNRGSTYKWNSSSTWEEYGSYELNTFLEKRVGLDGQALYGYDTLTLGWAGDGLPSLNHQLIAGLVGKDFYLGSLSLNPRPNNFTDYNNPIPSLIQNLRNASTPIPSSSWSYTAGSFNLAPKIFGSLILGGYDTTRFQPNNVTFPFGSDISLDFQVAIQSITTNLTETPLLSTGIVSYISTLVGEIWLPTAACKRFEDAFGLVWDNRTELYLMNDSLHESLLEKNPIVSFQVGPQVSGSSVTIELPYWNWYQTATSSKLGNSSSLYFPLKRAANDTQYVLGRAFLQSAYLSADYERNIFNLSQAQYPSSSTAENVVAILPPGVGSQSKASNSKSKIGTGAIAGIAVGGVVVLAIIATVIFIFQRRKKRSKEEEAHELEDTDANRNMRYEAAGDDLKYEVGDGLHHEVAGDERQKAELAAGDENQKPAEVDGAGRAIYELPTDEIKKIAEMEGEGHMKEMPVASEPKDIAASGTESISRRTTDASVIEYATESDRIPLTPPISPEERRGRAWR
ncbi:acid protease [Amniculicola lignicola CBS 123094]|uniref:Acid protease n=1 Tax=Amniculicola lignicola CBS 123094 TaxID=1392246 RepID=A0A6A5X368_9PLEO|nr:acid protease [Amniculicola lignicola CBS 123094]